jgi:peptidoglycan/LPS O-acetylase OafA/YrhL
VHPDQRYSSVKQLEFLPRIESLRGIAALTVVGCHVSGQLLALTTYGWLDGFASQLIAAFSNGTAAVVVFFVLSGFVLARSLDSNSDPLRFFRSRVFRLFPAAIAVVALLSLLHWQFGLLVGFAASFDPLNVILNSLMIRSDINGVMWSMTVECAATPLILLSVWLCKKQDDRLLWGLIAVLFGLSFWGPYVHLLGGFTNLAAFYAFVVGVLIHFHGARTALLVGPRLATATAFAAIGVFVLCGASKQTAPIMALECLSASILIMLIARRPDISLFKPFDFEVVRFYGRISYSLYLLHPLGILFAFRAIDPTTLHGWGMPLSLTIIFTTLTAVMFVTPAAWLIWRFVEMPAISVGRNLGRQPKLLTAN